MIHNTTLAAAVLLAFAGATTALAAYGFVQEQSHYFDAGTTEQQQVDAFLEHRRSAGLNGFTRQRFLIDCRNAVVSETASVLSPNDRFALREACRDDALAIAATDQNNSLAWFTAAHGALALNDFAAMNTYLAKSYSTGRNEGWIAQFRVETVENNFSHFDQTLLPQHEHDLALLIDSPAIEFVSTIYIDRPDARERITAVAEQLDDAVSDRFVEAVQRVNARRLQGGTR